MTLYTIGHLAKQYGVSTSTIRRWEAAGLIAALVMHEFRPTIRKKTCSGRSYGCAMPDATKWSATSAVASTAKSRG